MTKSESLFKFFSSFGLPAYPRDAVLSEDGKEEVELPYLTFGKGISDDYSTEIHLFYYTESEALPDNKAEEICDILRNGGRIISHDKGRIWITLGSPEWYSVPDEESKFIKHRLININVKDLR